MSVYLGQAVLIHQSKFWVSESRLGRRWGWEMRLSQSPLRPWGLSCNLATFSALGLQSVQMQSVFCLLRIRKERRKWRPMVTSGPFSGAGILASGGGRVWCPVCLVLGSHRSCLLTVLAFGKEQRQVGSLGLGQWVSEVGAC